MPKIVSNKETVEVRSRIEIVFTASEIEDLAEERASTMIEDADSYDYSVDTDERSGAVTVVFTKTTETNTDKG